ncbi:MAG: TonB C-terminal domain-containing protein [Inhella sp.]|jgi:hypothetical protein|uniref:TonB C-terminal domain-containing protein n=1 Tax=Inhella sp. TaxID=1921806 RepID=UPI0022BBDEF8|nr:TonB C-terminal domain-containing protein [Inhella sp.]MCZ8234854.1 TonB C-terminal domain-containing protein [Inhella sp.]
MGRQLDEERAQRDAAPQAHAGPSGDLPLRWNPLRRVRLYGHTDPNPEVVRYAQAWARKVQLNTPPETMRRLASLPHTPPLVTVAIRRDGSVESITFVIGSGVPAIDEAVRRIVQDQQPYPVFPTALAQDVDVLEIRRSWSFSTVLGLQ